MAEKEKLGDRASRSAAQVFRERIKAEGYTYAEVARALGVQPITISRFLGEKQRLTLDNLVAGARFFEISISELFKYAEKGKRVPGAEKLGGEPLDVSEKNLKEFLEEHGLSEEVFKKRVERLSSVEMTVLSLRSFISRPATLVQIAELMGLTKERVRQIYSNAVISVKQSQS